ncbi:aminotransferase class V-fold PLP-dependent enzyme [Actinokineospora sp. 24-640]
MDELMAEETRATAVAARLCGTTPEQVFLVPNTSLGLVQAAFGCRGEVVVPAADFPANTYPWARAEQAGLLTVRWLRAPATPGTVAAALTRDTAAVAVSAVDFRTGHRVDLAALRDVVGDRVLVVDGIQGFGAVGSAWAAADVLVVGGQKWLRAGWGTGFAALSERAMARLEPLVSSWTGVADPTRFDARLHDPADGAARWNITNLSPVTSGALATALDLVEGVGVPAIEARIAERVGLLADTIRAAGARVVSTGPTMLTVAAPDPDRAKAVLRDHGIAATVRADHIRFSPHASTSAETVDAIRAALRRL